MWPLRPLRYLKHVTRFLRPVLFFSLALRLLLAFTSIGFEHPNEFARTLEPIASMQGYSAHLPWEWSKGLLSPVPVAIQGKVIALGENALGLDPLGSSILLRCLLAFLSMLPILCSVAILQAFGASAAWQLAAALYLGFWPEWLFHSVRLMDYAWEGPLFALASLLLLRKPANAALAGFFLSLAFFFRPQSGLEWMGLSALFYLLEKAERRSLLFFVLSYAIGVIAIALLEKTMTGGALFSPVLAYWNFNWTQDGASAAYGADPWHRYFGESIKLFGAIPFLALLFGAFSSPVSRKFLLLFGVPFLVHSLVSHKEGRFLLGFAWALVPAGLLGLAQSRISEKSLRALVAFVLISAAFQAHRDFPKLLLRRDAVKEFNEARLAIETASKEKAIKRVLILGDPDFLPGGFFLRTKLAIEFASGISIPPSDAFVLKPFQAQPGSSKE